MRPTRLGQLSALATDHPAVALDRASHGALSVLAASLVGQDHVATSGRREDACAVLAHPTAPLLACAVADGVGSTAYSHAASITAAKSTVAALAALEPDVLGHALATPTAWAALAEQLFEHVAGGMTTHELKAMLAPADQQRLLILPERELPAATLSMAVVAPHEDGYRVAWAAVGDSPIFALEHPQGRLVAYWNPDHDGGTDSLPRVMRSVGSAFEWLPAAGTLLLASDGMGSALTRDLDLSRDILNAHVAGAPDPDLLRLLNKPISGVHDDRTLVMVTGAAIHTRTLRPELAAELRGG